jgi:rfaE bifunctional protein nucleotidyltransferase chain/domain
MENPKKKIMSLTQALHWRESLKNKGLKLAFTNGCFDLLHRGHIEYLLEARGCADLLLLALNSDKSVKLLKDPSRPLVGEKDRSFVIASLCCVDAVLLFNEARCVKLIKVLKPDVYVKGGDYNINNMDIDEKRALLSCGAAIKFVKFIKGCSTTSLIEKIKKT